MENSFESQKQLEKIINSINSFKSSIIKFINSKLVSNEEGNDVHMEYTFRISFMYTKWTINKRYSDFETLTEALKTKVKRSLLCMPPKRLFKNSESTIQEREREFTRYLINITSDISYLNIPEISNFLNISSESLHLFNTQQKLIQNKEVDLEQIKEETEFDSEKTTDEEVIIGNNYYKMLFVFLHRSNEYLHDGKNIITLLIDEFLSNLQDSKTNKTAVIKFFENFMDEQIKYFNAKDIFYLLTRRDINVTTPFIKDKTCKSKNSSPSSSCSNFSTLDARSFVSRSFVSETTKISTKEKNMNFALLKQKTQKQTKKIYGLLKQFSRMKKNYLAGQCCFDFIMKLIEEDYVPDCDKIIENFKNNFVDIIQEAQIYEHLLVSSRSDYDNKLFSFVNKLLGDNYKENDLQYIFNENTSIIEKFNNWSECSRQDF